jgi:hypothetical protein
MCLQLYRADCLMLEGWAGTSTPSSRLRVAQRALGEATMTGRYQGYHVLRDVDGGCKEVEVFWDHNGCGWFWRSRESHDAAIGPFGTSTEAYESATAGVIRGANFGRTG